MRFKPPDIDFLGRLDLDPLNSFAVFTPGYFLPVGIHSKGGSSGDNVDYAYNARMATIYESQNEWSNKFNSFWESYERPYEIAKIDANQRMLEGDTALAMEKTAAESKLLPGQTALSMAETKSAMDLLPLKTEYETQSLTTATEKQEAMRPVQDQFFSEAMDGVDANSWAAEAQADASRAFMGSQTATEMALARRGATPGSGAYTGQANENSFARTTALGMAATSGRESGERESFNRLSSAMNMGG